MQRNRFWLSLVGLCAAVACGFAIALALISATTAIAFASHQDRGKAAETKQDSASQQKTFKGVVTDSACGARHMTSGKSAAECTRECVAKGANYALVDGDRVYRLEGNIADMDRMAGQRTQVSGLLEGKVLTVNSIAPAQ
jgi:hypothetical protein